MFSLYTEQELKIMELKEQQKFWRYQLRNKDSRYSDFYINKMLDIISNKIKSLYK